MALGDKKPKFDDPTRSTESKKCTQGKGRTQRTEPTPGEKPIPKTVYFLPSLLDALQDYAWTHNYTLTKALNIVLADGLKGKEIKKRPRDRE